MRILTAEEESFLDAFLHETTSAPFTGPATPALQSIGVECRDISYLAWAYERDVPRTSFELGRPADIAPPLPWTSREAALTRDKVIQGLREQQRQPVGPPKHR
jgi:hypothetical protein